MGQEKSIPLEKEDVLFMIRNNFIKMVYNK